MASALKMVYQVKDIEQAKGLYSTVLGVEPHTDTPYYVGYQVNGVEIGLTPGEGQGPIGFWDVDDIDTSVKAAIAAGATEKQPATDVGGGTRTAVLADPDGNTFGFVSAS